MRVDATPRNPSNVAKHILRAVRNCPHAPTGRPSVALANRRLDAAQEIMDHVVAHTECGDPIETIGSLEDAKRALDDAARILHRLRNAGYRDRPVKALASRIHRLREAPRALHG